MSAGDGEGYEAGSYKTAQKITSVPAHSHGVNFTSGGSSPGTSSVANHSHTVSNHTHTQGGTFTTSEIGNHTHGFG